MDFVSRNFINLFLLFVVAGLAVGAGIAYTNTDVPYLTQFKPTATPTITIRSSLPAAAASPQAGATQPAAPGAGGAANPVAGRLGGRATVGVVEQADAASITVKTQDGTSVKASVGAGTAYQKTTTIALSDVKVGETVVATGQEDPAGALTAQAIQVGAAGGAAQGAIGGFQNPGGGAGAGGQAARARAIIGTVEAVDATSLTVAVEGGQKVKLTLASGASINRTIAATLNDVTAGETVSIIGQAGADGVVNAVTVQITAAGARR